MSINLDLLKTGPAQQRSFILFLDADLPGTVDTLIGGRIEPRLIALTDASNIAQYVSRQDSFGIIPMQHGLERHSGKAVFINRKGCCLDIIQFRFKENLFKRWMLFQAPAKGRNLPGCQSDQGIDFLQHGIQIVHLLRHYLQDMDRCVLCQHDAISIQHKSAYRGQCLNPDMIIQ